MDNIEKAKQVISNFLIEGVLQDLHVNTQGHINSTFISTFIKDGSTYKYTHQKINKSVFTHPDEVMENILKVTKHIQEKVKSYPDRDKRSLKVILSKDGKPYYIDEDGEYWRTYSFIDDVNTFDSISDPLMARNLGLAIGQFQLYLSDFDGSSLYTTISHFHDMNLRYKQLEEAIKNNRANRLEEVKAEIDFLMDNKERGCVIWNEFENGIVPTRVTHNDTKMNNVLFSKENGEGLCVIDLDTIMPGTILFDTGDMIRTACNTATEDEKDLSKVDFNTALYKALYSGYVEKASVFLTDREKEQIKESGRTITQIMAVRFLTDYINGDVYYHTLYKEHNLVRARNQIALIKAMDRHWSEIEC